MEHVVTLINFSVLSNVSKTNHENNAPFIIYSFGFTVGLRE